MCYEKNKALIRMGQIFNFPTINIMHIMRNLKYYKSSKDIDDLSTDNIMDQ